MHLAFLSTLLGVTLVQGAALLPSSNATAKSCNMILKPEHNPNIRCGWPGPLVPGQIATLGLPFTVSDLESCAELCHDDRNCISFGLTAASCQLYSKSLLDMGIEPALPGADLSTTFYNKGCWKPVCTAPPTPCLCTARVTGMSASSFMTCLQIRLSERCTNEVPETVLVYNTTRTHLSTTIITTSLPQATETLIETIDNIACKENIHLSEPNSS